MKPLRYWNALSAGLANASNPPQDGRDGRRAAPSFWSQCHSSSSAVLGVSGFVPVVPFFNEFALTGFLLIQALTESRNSHFSIVIPVFRGFESHQPPQKLSPDRQYRLPAMARSISRRSHPPPVELQACSVNQDEIRTLLGSGPELHTTI